MCYFFTSVPQFHLSAPTTDNFYCMFFAPQWNWFGFWKQNEMCIKSLKHKSQTGWRAQKPRKLLRFCFWPKISAVCEIHNAAVAFRAAKKPFSGQEVKIIISCRWMLLQPLLGWSLLILQQEGDGLPATNSPATLQAADVRCKGSWKAFFKRLRYFGIYFSLNYMIARLFYCGFFERQTAFVPQTGEFAMPQTGWKSHLAEKKDLDKDLVGKCILFLSDLVLYSFCRWGHPAGSNSAGWPGASRDQRGYQSDPGEKPHHRPETSRSRGLQGHMRLSLVQLSVRRVVQSNVAFNIKTEKEKGEQSR